MSNFIVKYRENSAIKSHLIEAENEVNAGREFSRTHPAIKSDDVVDVVRQKHNYFSYDEVPTYRKQWVFWLLYFTLTPIALGILLFGDVYYQSNGVVKSFGVLNRIAAMLVGVIIFARIFNLI